MTDFYRWVFFVAKVWLFLTRYLQCSHSKISFSSFLLCCTYFLHFLQIFWPFVDVDSLVITLILMYKAIQILVFQHVGAGLDLVPLVIVPLNDYLYFYSVQVLVFSLFNTFQAPFSNFLFFYLSL